MIPLAVEFFQLRGGFDVLAHVGNDRPHVNRPRFSKKR